MPASVGELGCSAAFARRFLDLITLNELASRVTENVWIQTNCLKVGEVHEVLRGATVTKEG